MTKKIDLYKINQPQDEIICNCRICGQEKICEIERAHYGVIRICKSCYKQKHEPIEFLNNL